MVSQVASVEQNFGSFFLLHIAPQFFSFHNIKLIFRYASMKKAAQWSSNLILSCEFKFEYLQTFTHQIMLVLRRICEKCYIISNILCFLNNVNTLMLMVTGSQGPVVRSCADY